MIITNTSVLRFRVKKGAVYNTVACMAEPDTLKALQQPLRYLSYVSVTTILRMGQETK